MKRKLRLMIVALIPMMLVFISSINCQEMLLKKRVDIGTSGDTISVAELFFDSNNFLTFFSGTNYGSGDSSYSTYINDTLVSDSFNNTYEYFNDSIVIYNNGSWAQTYYLNNLDEIVYDGYYHYTWFENNMIGFTIGSNSYSYEYDHEYKNPWFNESKYFKYHINGSEFLVSKSYKNDTVLRYENIILESIYGYPTKIKQISYSSSGSYWTERHFYYNVISNTPEKPHKNSYKVLSVSYFNLSGQQIEKPRSGFFIKREVTTSGMVSTKHFIP